MSKNPALQALLDMQDDGTTVDVTVGEKIDETKDVAIDNDYIGYLLNERENPSNGISYTAEFDDLELDDYLLD